MTMRRFWRRLPVVGALVLLATVIISVPVAANPPPTAPATEVVGTGSITIVKDAMPNAATNFSYVTTGAGVARSFALDDDANPALARTRTFRNLTAGTYTFREAAVTGWALTRLTCNRPETVNLTLRKVTIRLTAGENVRCTFTNSRRGSITITKEVLGAVETHLAPDFDFTATGTGVSDFQLDDDQDFDPTLADTRTFSNLVPGAYRFVEEVEPGFFLTDLTCTTTERSQVLQRQVDITLSAGEHVTCTFQNAALSAGTGSLQVVKLRGADGPVTDFDLTVTGPGGYANAFTLTPRAAWVGAAWNTLLGLTPGAYQISELVPPGWELTGLRCNPAGVVNANSITVNVAAGRNTICTFGDQPAGATPAQATLTIVKDTRPDDPTEFQFTSTANPGYTNFGLADDGAGANSVTFPVTPGRLYDVEELPQDGWALSSARCDRGIWWRWQDVLLFWAVPGQNITCTFVNEAPATVTIVKQTDPADPQTFTYRDLSPVPLGAPASFILTHGNQQVFPGVAPGGYTLQEDRIAGWIIDNTHCTGATGPTTTDQGRGTFQFWVGPGANVVCTVTNVHAGGVTIVKDAQPDDAQLFRFSSHTIPGLSPFPLSDGGTEADRLFIEVAPHINNDFYELVPAGWDLTDVTCDLGIWSFDHQTHAVTIRVAEGQEATCTFVNQRHGSITIIKDTRPDGPRDFFFTPSWQTGFSLDDDTDPTHDNSATFTDLAPGDYTVTESAVTGWQVTDIACTGGLVVPDVEARTVDIALAAGQDITCTFVNERPATTGTITIVEDSRPHDAQDFFFTPSWQTGFSLDDDTDPTHDNSATYTDLAPGSYTVSQGWVDDWHLTDIQCAGGTNAFGHVFNRQAYITLAAGEHVTCTFTNDGGSIAVQVEPTGEFVWEMEMGFGLDNHDTYIWTLPGTDCRIGESCSIPFGGSNPPPGEREFGALPPGTYTVNATGGPFQFDYGDVTCTSGGTGDPVNHRADITLDPGARVTCTFSIEPRWDLQYGPTVGDLDGTIEVFHFGYGVNGPTPSTSTADCAQNPAGAYLCDYPLVEHLAPGDWSITETSTDPNAVLSAIECESLTSTGDPPRPTSTTFTPDVGAATVDIHVEGQDQVACYFRHLQAD